MARITPGPAARPGTPAQLDRKGLRPVNEESEAPTAEEIADARRSGALAGTQGFPAGVCPHDPRQGGKAETLAQAWLAAYGAAKTNSEGA